MTKLFGYVYEIIYRKGKENVVVNALSKKYEEEGSLFSLSFIVIDWLQAVRQEWFQDSKISSLIQKLQQDPQDSWGYSWDNEELCYKGCLYLSKQLTLKSTTLSKFHASPTVVHSGFTKNYEWVKHSFFCDNMKHEIHSFVVECDTC